MKQRDATKYLQDILNACELISTFVASKSFEEYRDDLLLRSAVERQLEIIGEAVGNVLRIEPLLESKIDHARRIVGLRNRLIHAYSDISAELVWGIIETYLTELRDQTAKLLEPNRL